MDKVPRKQPRNKDIAILALQVTFSEHGFDNQYSGIFRLQQTKQESGLMEEKNFSDVKRKLSRHIKRELL
ncbi:hypothetical protein P5673_007508 [Acropora cervicornis]|uniref:Uncharacterized protein n=1 Tax=Acropora cervicornis TaxID=6130 RepID=A0AAD9QVT1_ACRCE|nr:hypothetical protein P5673_007508 [Acropora cervicornis]